MKRIRWNKALCILPVSYTHLRDPKLFQMADGTFRMVLGAWLQDDKGAVLLYSSTDLELSLIHI